MQITNETTTRLTEFVDEFKKTVQITDETASMLLDMMTDEFGLELSSYYISTYQGIDNEDEW